MGHLKVPFIRLADYIARPYNMPVWDKRMTPKPNPFSAVCRPALAADKTLTLTGNPAHYLRNVLRAAADDAVLVSMAVMVNGTHITAIDKRRSRS